MAIRDYWIYQKRIVKDPWVFYIVKEFDKRGGEKAVCIDFTFYHENIENPTHSVSKVGLHYDKIAGYVDEMLSVIADFSDITSDDVEQLLEDMEKIVYKE